MSRFAASFEEFAMKAIGLVVLTAILLVWTSEAPAGNSLPAAAQEVLTQYEEESADIQRKTEMEAIKLIDRTTEALKAVQDAFCKEARLEDAIAVRDLIRTIQQDNGEIVPVRDVPRAARKAYHQHLDDMTILRRKHEVAIEDLRDKVVGELKKMQDGFCKEGKFEEAVTIRDLGKSVREGLTNVLADPGLINNAAPDIGKTFYYETTGGPGSVYGDGIYTTGSSLAATAVHTGILKMGQKGIVKVTILPGQDRYVAATRNEITSLAYGTWGVSFKVERSFGFAARTPPNPPTPPAPQVPPVLPPNPKATG
jgi:hypothetical protein